MSPNNFSSKLILKVILAKATLLRSLGECCIYGPRSCVLQKKMNTSNEGRARIRQGKILNVLDRLQAFCLNPHAHLSPILNDSDVCYEENKKEIEKDDEKLH